MRTPENSWLWGTLINKSSSKSLHTYTETKLHPRANKFQSKTYHANSPATQEHSPELQYTGCPKSLQTHWHLITHYWKLHCTPERRNPSPPTRTPKQASLTRKPWQAPVQPHPQWGNSTIKRTPQTARIWKGQPKHLENKMELQINSLETRIEKIQEMFNKDLEEIKNSQWIMQ